MGVRSHQQILLALVGMATQPTHHMVPLSRRVTKKLGLRMVLRYSPGGLKIPGGLKTQDGLRIVLRYSGGGLKILQENRSH